MKEYLYYFEEDEDARTPRFKGSYPSFVQEVFLLLTLSKRPQWFKYVYRGRGGNATFIWETNRVLKTSILVNMPPQGLWTNYPYNKITAASIWRSPNAL